jgi:hypothetical protein
MRFSLKDLMWSVTLASLGLVSFSIGLNPVSWARIFQGVFFVLSAVLLGASIGKLFHQAWNGSLVGVMVVVVVLVGFLIFTVIANIPAIGQLLLEDF